MPRSLSAVDRAGERTRGAVRAGQRPSEDDLLVVEEFRADYVTIVMDLFENLEQGIAPFREAWEPAPASVPGGVLGDLPFLAVAARPKTMESIVAKLARETTRLSQMQDLAGGRIVVPSLEAQEMVLQGYSRAQRLLPEAAPELAGLADPIRVHDTRELGDRLGYRAVHLVHRVMGRAGYEIQIRTSPQQGWAQLVERVDQHYGWDLKHGLGPDAWLSWLYNLSEYLHDVDLGESPNKRDFPAPPHPLV